MYPDDLSQTLQKGFRVTLGATASLIEAIQDPQGSSQRFSALGGDVNRITEELEIKGETTEREARVMVDALLSQMPNPFGGAAEPAGPTITTVASPVVSPSVQDDLAALTQELAAMRRDIEALKAQG
jgi:polyhydroxyalkanoate synthesis regulator phasin